MSGDLVSRQDAIEELHKQCVKRRMDGEGEMFDEFDIEDVLRKLPSAEPERKTGKWIDGMPYVNSHWKVCSECHVSAPDSCGGFNFCPNCGAEMRGEE